MAIVVDIMHGYNHSIEMLPQLQPKMTKVRLYWQLIWQARAHYMHYILITGLNALDVKVSVS